MKKLLLSLAAALLALSLNVVAQPATQPAARMGRMGGMGAMGGGPRGADVPAPRNDANVQKAHQQHIEKAKAGKGKIDLYFIGDSIFRRWGATDYPTFLDNFKRNFWGWNAADFAWGADLIQNILWRAQNGELDDVNPKVIVILAGTNNLNANGGDANVDDIIKGMQALLKTCQEKAPKANIILMGILPRNDNMGHIAQIKKVNEKLEKLADGKTIRYLNVNDKFADKDGKLFDGLTVDRLHPDLKGYQIIADALNPLLTQLLGPKANEDHAPPATGDPSATKPAQPEPKDPFVPPTK